MGAATGSFTTSSDSPVSWLSSTLRRESSQGRESWGYGGATVSSGRRARRKKARLTAPRASWAARSPARCSAPAPRPKPEQALRPPALT
jgi:hypothetical protein